LKFVQEFAAMWSFLSKSRRDQPARLFETLENRTLLCVEHFDLGDQSRSADNRTPDADLSLAPAAWTRRFNFQPDGGEVPDFYRVDTGAAYGLRANGLTYGWNTDNRDGRDRGVLSDQRYDTLHHLQRNGQSFRWDMAIENGTYTVRVVAGDPSYNDSVYKINVENVLTVNGTPTSSNRFVEGTATVSVTDGKLTISNASGAVNNKINFVEICKGVDRFPVVSVAATDSSAGEAGGNTGTFAFTRTGSTAEELTASYAVGGSAGSGDYAALSGIVTFAAGASTATVAVIPIDDSAVEASETVTVSVRPAEAYSHAFNSSATITIADNDTGGGGGGSLGTLSWSTKAFNLKARSEGFGGVVAGKFYTFGGYVDSTYKPTNQAHVYNPATNSWKQLKNIPIATSHVATANDERYIYTAGGYPAATASGAQAFATDKSWRYDTTNDTWAALPNLPAARGSMAMALVGRTLFAFGGSDASRVDKSDHWALNLDNTASGWIRKTSMPAARNHFAAVAINGLVYSVGGQTKQDSQSIYHPNVFRYNPASNAWDSVAPMIGQARSHANNSTIVHNGRIIILGGVTNANSTTMSNVEAYDPQSNKWSVLAALPRRTMAGVAGSLGGNKIIFSTGFGGGIMRGETYVGTFA
jgi:N-acetylneuraminic acid mutarotase